MLVSSVVLLLSAPLVSGLNVLSDSFIQPSSVLWVCNAEAHSATPSLRFPREHLLALLCEDVLELEPERPGGVEVH